MIGRGDEHMRMIADGPRINDRLARGAAHDRHVDFFVLKRFDGASAVSDAQGDLNVRIERLVTFPPKLVP